MKRGLFKIITYVVLIVMVLGLIALAVFIKKQKDVTPPTISFAKEITYKQGNDYSTLLDGVSAYDLKDGDVSDSIIIERVLPIEDNTQAIVHYVAKDKNNNLCKARHAVKYIPDPNATEQNNTRKRFYKVMVINNTGVDNLATEWAYLLRDNGHTITAVGRSNDILTKKTQILVQKQGEGTELLEFFPNAEISVGSAASKVDTAPNGAQVYVLLGTDDAHYPQR